MTSYHPGELAVQRQMGQADFAERVERIIRSAIPPRAATFLAEQPMIVVAAADEAGRMWTSLIVGSPGFTHADDARTITVDALPVPGDPLADALRKPRRIGMIALQPQHRRRMRVNGIAHPDGHGMRIHTDQVYSNCPKYISRRHIEGVRMGGGLPQVLRATALDDRQRRAIAGVDTFFIGSADAQGNADASHRGGNPGFLQVLSPTRLRWPDYRGNSMFMTLGNLHENPQCGLLVPDWRNGTTLQLTGTAEIDWDETAFAPGAQCSVDFTVTQIVEITNASPLRWGTAELSPVNPA
jgi:predicted pyridoxine 5'-phosphate oxidase superfamily flavin-nucleotide-binding protein